MLYCVCFSSDKLHPLAFHVQHMCVCVCVCVCVCQTRDLLRLPSEVIMRLESPVIQVDSVEDKVLVSTTKASYVAVTSV